MVMIKYFSETLPGHGAGGGRIVMHNGAERRLGSIEQSGLSMPIFRMSIPGYMRTSA